MEITALFKACVKTLHTTQKNMGGKEHKYSISKTRRDVHLEKAKIISKKITDFRSFLQENKAAYLNVLNYLSVNKAVTKIDHQQIDHWAEHNISQCKNLINEYKKEIYTLVNNKQKKEHYQNVIETLDIYLKNVSKVYTEAKAILVKRVIETHKLSKLETKSKITLSSNNDNMSKLKIQPDTTVVSTPKNYESELTAEDMQIFESENEMLYNELNSLSDEVKQMENKVVHIAELQELFTEKVLQQDQDVDRIATTVIGSTEDMKDANEQIRQAIQRNAGLRVWVLFFLLVLSFSLLFLDWYNE